MHEKTSNLRDKFDEYINNTTHYTIHTLFYSIKQKHIAHERKGEGWREMERERDREREREREREKWRKVGGGSLKREGGVILYTL